MSKMNKLIVFILIQLFIISPSNYLLGQNVLIEVSGFNSDQENPYAKVNNGLKIVAEGKMCNELTVWTDNGTIHPILIKNCAYSYIPNHIGKSSIYIATINEADTVFFKEVQIEVKPLPFTLTIGKEVVDCKCKIEISKSEFLTSVLTMESINMNISASAKIVGLSITVLRDSERIYFQEFGNYDETVADIVKSDLNILKAGDTVFLEKILYKYFEDMNVIADSIEININ